MNRTYKRIALAGNPNAGKSSIFNALTGMNQRVSNFPGVTVEKKVGKFSIGAEMFEVIDIPGTYSLFPNAADEKLAVEILTNKAHSSFPDLIVYVADATQLERHFLLATQLKDLGFELIFVINMIDLVEVAPDLNKISAYLNSVAITCSARHGLNIQELKNIIQSHFENLTLKKETSHKPLLSINATEKELFEEINLITGHKNLYLSKILAHHFSWLNISSEWKEKIETAVIRRGFHNIKSQVEEVMQRFQSFDLIIKNATFHKQKNNNFTVKFDKIITNKFAGPIIFFLLLFFIFQSVFAWASYPMDLIETGFSSLASYLTSILPDHFLTNLLTNGILAGLSGVIIFIPQITILFFLISLLEESGYMSRAVYMFDNIMQKFGMNGRSIVALVSSGACAIPAIMSTRTISNPKEKLITILVSPLISCSARLPVYAVLVGFVIAETTVFGVFNAQGLVFMGLYMLGIIAALGSAFVFKKLLKSEETSYLMMELPQYKPPLWKNVFLTVKNKVGSFIVEAGKVILIISIALWFLASYGPTKSIADAEKKATTEIKLQNLNEEDAEILSNTYKLEASYAGIMGKWIEPVIRPLGYDWKIGIALITSFAAREVFVGTMATIYSVGNTDETATLRQKMALEKKQDGIRPMYDTATSLSLLIFYVFAMQCMSTLAVTKKETGTWKWPFVQFFYMGGLAYFGALLVYNLFK